MNNYTHESQYNTMYIKASDLSEEKQEEIRQIQSKLESQEDDGYINWDEFYIQVDFNQDGDIFFN